MSDADVLSADQVKTMADNPIIFARQPERRLTSRAHDAGVKIWPPVRAVPNQVNNILSSLASTRACWQRTFVDYGLETAIAGDCQLVPEPVADRFVPGVFDKGVVDTVAAVRDYAASK